MVKMEVRLQCCPNGAIICKTFLVVFSLYTQYDSCTPSCLYYRKFQKHNKKTEPIKCQLILIENISGDCWTFTLNDEIVYLGSSSLKTAPIPALNTSMSDTVSFSVDTITKFHVLLSPFSLNYFVFFELFCFF